jgi:Carboxypeptidase regulatory-like domain/TonB dependent receptor
MTHARPAIRFSCFLLFALCLSTRVFALNNASAVTGIVVDPTGAVVRGATVDVIAHNEKLYTVSTDQQGHHSVSVPAVGNYEIRVSAPGLKTAVAANQVLRNSEESIRNFTLRLDAQAFRAQGVEAEAQVQISRDLFVRGGYTYLDAVVQRSFSSDAIGPTHNPNFPTSTIGAYSPLIGARPFRRAPHTSYFGVSYAHARFSSLLTGTLVGRRDDSDFLAYDANYMATMLLPNRSLDGGYQRLDLSASYQVSSRIQMTSRLQNLLSERYSEAFGYPALPFTFRSGVQLTLGGESWKLK